MAGRPSTIAEIRKLPVVPNRKYQTGAPVPVHDESLGTASRSIAQAAHIRGTLAPQSCDHCSGGRKKMFAECVTLPGYMAGRCSNCHFAMDGRRCSLAASRKRPRSPSPRRSTSRPSHTIGRSPQDGSPITQETPRRAAVRDPRYSRAQALEVQTSPSRRRSPSAASPQAPPPSPGPPPPTVMPSDPAALHGLPIMTPDDIPRVGSWVLNNCDWRPASRDGTIPFDPDEQYVTRRTADSVTTGRGYDRKSVWVGGLQGRLVELVGNIEQAMLEGPEMESLRRSFRADAARMSQLARQAGEVLGRMEVTRRRLGEEAAWAQSRSRYLEAERRTIKRHMKRAGKGVFKAAWDKIPSMLQWGTRDGAALSLVHGQVFRPPLCTVPREDR